MVSFVASVCTALAVGGILAWLLARNRLRRHAGPTLRRPGVPGREVTRTQYLGVSIGAGVLTFTMTLTLTGLPIVSAVPGLVVSWLPRVYFRRKHALRLAAVQDAWPDGLRDILSSIRSGASLGRAVEDLAAFGPEPLRDAFQGFGVYARSLGMVAALELVKEDLADPASDRVIEILVLAHERGGTAVPDILEDLTEAATKDLWTAEAVRTEALEQKINSRVVFVLPWIVLIAMTSRPGPFRDFYGTSAGLAVVAVGGLLSLVGILIASRLGATPIEPRVFGGRK